MVRLQVYGSDDDSTYQRNTKTITLACLYFGHALVLIVGASMRRIKYRDVGLYSLNVQRPKRYWVKIALHFALMLALGVELACTALQKQRYDGDWYWLLRVVAICAELVEWAAAALVMRFEYRRALGHIWYMHPLYVWSAAAVYCTDLLL